VTIPPASDKVPTYLFKGDDVPPSHAREVLRERFSGNYDLILPPKGPIRVAGAEHLGLMLGGMVLLRRRMYEHGLARGPGHIRKSQVDHYALALSIAQEGPSRHLVDNNRLFEQRTHEPLLYDMARPIRMDIKSGTDVTLFVPRDAIDALLPRRLDLHGVLPRGAVARLLADHLKLLSERAEALTLDEAQLVSRSTLHLIAASLAPMADSMALARPQLEYLLVRRIGSYVDQHLADPGLSVEQLCAAFHLSRTTLYRLLEPVGGVAAFIRERRLSKINELLVASDQRLHLKRLAFDFGFRSATHFSRAFREQFGYAPSEANVHLARPAPGDSNDSDGQRVASWLYNLR
jgi:AraC-like DNA-binding protein